MSKSFRNALIVTAAYFLLYWGIVIPCDIMSELHKQLDYLVFLPVVAAALFALMYVPLEKRLCDDEHMEYNGIVVMMSLVFLVIAYLLAFYLIGPQLISYYKEQGDLQKNLQNRRYPGSRP